MVGSYVHVQKLSTAAGELRDALSGSGAWHQQRLLHVPTSPTRSFLTSEPQILPPPDYSPHELDQIPKLRVYNFFLFALENIYANIHCCLHPCVLGLFPSAMFPSLNCDLLKDRNSIPLQRLA